MSKEGKGKESSAYRKAEQHDADDAHGHGHGHVASAADPTSNGNVDAFTVVGIVGLAIVLFMALAPSGGAKEHAEKPKPAAHAPAVSAPLLEPTPSEGAEGELLPSGEDDGELELVEEENDDAAAEPETTDDVEGEAVDDDDEADPPPEPPAEKPAAPTPPPAVPKPAAPKPAPAAPKPAAPKPAPAAPKPAAPSGDNPY
jgi:hypothetical protein